ncbi:ribonuclease inhibitor-like [Mobula hypostoma]|uniref:ribonuclease inhibitor-like n=1 Tax=Mobula hypostoma TaxID=723540 RepID=UPI002FC28C84
MGSRLREVGLTDSGAEDLVSALTTNPSLTELDLSINELGDSGVKLVSAALKNPECKIQRLRLREVGLTDSGAEDLVSALSTKSSLTELNLGFNSLTDRSVPALRRLILTLPRLERIGLDDNQFSRTGRNELRSLQEPRPGLTVSVCTARPRDADILADSPPSPLTPALTFNGRAPGLIPTFAVLP